MPDEDDNTAADEETIPQTSLHGYKEGREDDVRGDVEKLKEGDPKESQQREIADDDESDLGPPVHDKA